MVKEPEIRNYTKLSITGIEYSEGISDANLLDPSLEDLHLFLRSDGKRVNAGASYSVRGGNLPVLSICGHSAKSLKDSYSGFHSPKNRVLVVKERCRSEGEEELGTCKFLDVTR